MGPGQVTDDSEMAIALLEGLLESQSKLNPENIIKYYAKWMDSKPFGRLSLDDGQT